MSAGQSILLGALLGLAVMTRPQEALFALLPAALLLFAREPFPERVRAAVRLAAWAFVGVVPFLVLQAIHSAVLLSREPFALVGGGGYLDFLDSHWASTLWSSWHGFFSWTPIAYLAFLAMFVYARRNGGWALATIAVILLMAWVNGATEDWAAGWSFGGRRFVSTLALLAPGVALIVNGLVRNPMVALVMLGAVAIAWNQLLLLQRTNGMLRHDAQISFAQIIRQQAALVTGPSFVYPFAFPANALFAWRTGLPMDAYDLLGAETLRDRISIEMTPVSDRYLLDGWGTRVTDPFGDLRWIEGNGAELLLPLDPPRDRELVVTWSARTRRLDPPALATFALVINGRETFRFTPDTEQETFYSFAAPGGADFWVRGFNRIGFARRDGSPPMGIYGIEVR
jgi:hypothetical protein